jgi:hypothetical protein
MSHLTVSHKYRLTKTPDEQEGTIYVGEQCSTTASAEKYCTESGYKVFLKANFGPVASLVGQFYSLKKFAVYGELAVAAAISQVITDSDYNVPATAGSWQQPQTISRPGPTSSRTTQPAPGSAPSPRKTCRAWAPRIRLRSLLYLAIWTSA